MHPEAYLQIAREWPHEYYAVDTYKTDALDDVHPPATDGGLGAAARARGRTVIDGTEFEPVYSETYNTRFWAMAAVLGLTAYGVGTALQAMPTDPATGLHPFSALIGRTVDGFTDSPDAKAEQAGQHYALLRDDADAHHILAYEPAKPWRLNFPGRFERRSDHGVEPGSEVDVSQVRIKHTWQEDDAVRAYIRQKREQAAAASRADE